MVIQGVPSQNMEKVWSGRDPEADDPLQLQTLVLNCLWSDVWVNQKQLPGP